VFVATAVALGLTACGSDPDPEPESDSPSRTVTVYLTALAEGDGERACDELSRGGRSELRLMVSTHLQMTRMRGCVASAEQLSDAMYPGLADELIDPEVDDVKVDGAKATAKARGAPALMRLVRRRGDWLIDEHVKGGWPEMGVPAEKAPGQ
jgi:hypothetical protein